MHPTEILRILRAEGLQVSASGGSLIVHPKERITDKTRALIRDHKATLLRALQPHPPTPEASGGLDLAALVERVGAAWGFTVEETDEALRNARARPDEAFRCFRALAAEVQLAALESRSGAADRTPMRQSLPGPTQVGDA